MSRIVTAAALAALSLSTSCERPAGPGQSAAFSAFADVAVEAGITFRHDNGHDAASWRVVETVNGGVALLDFDGDGRLDIYFTNARKPDPGPSPPRNALFRNLGGWRFEDVSARAGVDDDAFSLGCAVADVDGDGDPDLHVTNLGPDRLYLNNGDGTFTDVAGRAGIGGNDMSSGSAFLDIDGDGDLDLYVASYVLDDKTEHPPAMLRGVPSYWPPLNYRPALDRLWENHGDGVFTDVSERSGIRDVEPGRGLGVVSGDFNGDGRADIYVANDMSANFMFLGDGAGRLTEEGYFNGTALGADGAVLGSMGIAVGDPDGDGRADLFVTNYQDQPNNFYRSLPGGHFQESVDVAGLAGGTLPDVSWGTGFVDLDLDGFEDVFIASGHLNPETRRMDETTSFEQANRIYRNRGDGTFEDVSGRSGEAVRRPLVSRGAAFGDLDNDGDLDVVVVNAAGAPQLLRNDSPPGRAWALVELIGAGRNRDAIGARVTVHAGGRGQWRERRSSESYLSANDPRLHFGLGSATRIDRLEVRWPDGAVETHEGLPVRKLIVVRRGEERCEVRDLAGGA